MERDVTPAQSGARGGIRTRTAFRPEGFKFRETRPPDPSRTETAGHRRHCRPANPATAVKTADDQLILCAFRARLQRFARVGQTAIPAEVKISLPQSMIQQRVRSRSSSDLDGSQWASATTQRRNRWQREQLASIQNPSQRV